MSMGCPSVCACAFSNRLAVDFLIKLLPPYVRLSVRLSVPWRSCLGYRHADCLQLSHRRPPEMCGLRTRPRTDVDPPRFLPPSNCHRRGGEYRLADSGAIPCFVRFAVRSTKHFLSR